MTRYVPPAAHPADLQALTASLRAAGTDAAVVAVTTAEDVDALLGQLDAGRTVIAFTSPSAWEAVGEAFAVGIDPAPAAATATDPLVAQRSTTATATGATAGMTVDLERAGVITAAWLTADQVLLAGKGRTHAIRQPRGRGEAILIAGCLPEGGAVTPTGTWAIATATGLTGQALHDALAASGQPARHTVHPAALVVPAGPWDLTGLPHDATGVNDPALLRAAGHAGRTLPANVHDALIDFADTPSAAGAMLITGAPVGQVPATPPSPTQAVKPDLVSEYVLLSVARRLGQPIGYAPEHGGDLVQNVCPTQSGATRQVSTSSRVVLEYHTEAAHHPHRPRFLLLLCLRGDPDAATTLCSVNAILGELTADERATLSQPRFTTGIDESYTGIPSTARSLPRPILTGPALRPKLWLDNDLMRGVDAQAQAALERIAELARTRGTSVTLAAGDILVVDNDLAVHGRSPFTPRFDGTDRWLQRSMVVPDHTALGADLAGRIAATEFTLA